MAAARCPRILLADADAFFVAVARLVDPEGAGRAECLIVGGARDSRGVVCSASYEARRFGVRSAMSIAQARRLCPQATFVPVPRKACGQKSAEIRAVLQRYAPVVEGASVDEWYLDLSGTEGVYHDEPLEATAQRIRTAVRESTGLTLSIGGGTNKLIAKLAVDRAKPRTDPQSTGVVIVPAGHETEFLRTCTLAEIPGVGPKAQARLASRGLITVPDLLAQDLAGLRRWLGHRHATWLWNRAHGVDEAAVVSRGANKGISRDETFNHDLEADRDIERELFGLVSRAASDMRGSQLAARTIAVKLRDWDFQTRSAQRTLPEAVTADRVIMAVARELLDELRHFRRVPARLVGVRLSTLVSLSAADQLNLFAGNASTNETARDLALTRAVDGVRRRFGDSSILPARLTD